MTEGCKPPQQQEEATPRFSLAVLTQWLTWKRLKGGLLLALGYLLSPLCWWNDLIFNLPIAYLFGYGCSRISPDWFLPCSVLGYWLSNLVGILLMQAGFVEVFQDQAQEKNWKKELFNGLISSTIYTALIIALLQLKVFDTSALFAENQPINFGFLSFMEKGISVHPGSSS